MKWIGRRRRRRRRGQAQRSLNKFGTCEEDLCLGTSGGYQPRFSYGPVVDAPRMDPLVGPCWAWARILAGLQRCVVGPGWKDGTEFEADRRTKTGPKAPTCDLFDAAMVG